MPMGIEHLPPAPDQQKEIQQILNQCREIKDQLFALPSCRLTVGQLLTLGDAEMFGLSKPNHKIDSAKRLLADFERLRDEIMRPHD